MTRKDYEKLAEAVREARHIAGTYPEASTPLVLDGINLLMREVEKVLAADNGRFDRDRFEEACKL